MWERLCSAEKHILICMAMGFLKALSITSNTSIFMTDSKVGGFWPLLFKNFSSFQISLRVVANIPFKRRSSGAQEVDGQIKSNPKFQLPQLPIRLFLSLKVQGV